MQFKKWLTPLIVIFFTFLILAACGHIEEKPTGLEDTKNNQTESIAKADVDETEIDEVSEGQEKDKKKNSEVAEDKGDKNKSEDHSDKSNKSSAKKESDQTNSTSKKEQENTKKTDESTGDQSKKSTEDQKKKTSKKQSTTSEKKKESKGSDAQESNTDKKSENQPKTEDKKPSENKPAQKEKDSKITITLSIIGLSNDVIIGQEDFKVKKDNNAFDVLLDIGKNKGLSVESTGTGGTGYIQGIEGYREFGEGDLSGWMYSVNGTFPNIGAGTYTLEDGDVVEWLYTTDLGEDIGAR